MRLISKTQEEAFEEMAVIAKNLWSLIEELDEILDSDGKIILKQALDSRDMTLD